MENVKKNINMNHICGKTSGQFTLNDDFNVPDDKPDIYKKITDNGEVVIEGIRNSDGKTTVTGFLKFSMLYQSDYGNTKTKKGKVCPFAGIEGKIEFSENMNVPGIKPTDTIKIVTQVDDLTITIINSRKISVMAVVSYNVLGENTYTTMAITDIDDKKMQVLKKNLDMLIQIENKKDILRVREQYELPSSKPNIGEIIWSVTKIRNLETKTATDELVVGGDIYVFAMYETEDAGDNIQYIEAELPFIGKLAMNGVKEDMIPDISVSVSQSNVLVRPDYDGEQRILECEMVLDLDVKVYEEQSVSLITDVYSVDKKISPTISDTSYNRLLIRNHSRCKASNKFRIDDRKDKILQIINSSANVNIDDCEINEKGIMAEGVILVSIIYISDNDDERIGCLNKELPFNQQIDVPEINKECFYSIKPQLEQMSTMMLGSDEIEVKASLGLDTLVLEPMKENVITELMEEDICYEEIKKMPGIYGHIVKAGENLWDIAKEHYTTKERIMADNNLGSENLTLGMKLLVVR